MNLSYLHKLQNRQEGNHHLQLVRLSLQKFPEAESALPPGVKSRFLSSVPGLRVPCVWFRNCSDRVNLILPATCFKDSLSLASVSPSRSLSRTTGGSYLATSGGRVRAYRDASQSSILPCQPAHRPSACTLYSSKQITSFCPLVYFLPFLIHFLGKRSILALLSSSVAANH